MEVLQQLATLSAIVSFGVNQHGANGEPEINKKREREKAEKKRLCVRRKARKVH